MQFSETSDSSVLEMNRLRRLYLFLGAMGLSCLVLTFLIASSHFGDNQKLSSVAGIAAVFLFFCFVSYKSHWNVKPAGNILSAEPDGVSADTTESKLTALDEAYQLFGTSLSSPDMFRLIASRTADIFPFAACILYLADKNKEKLTIVQTEGKKLNLLANVEIGTGEGAAGRAFASGSIEITADIKMEKRIWPDVNLESFRSTAAIPLVHGNEIFGVYQVYTGSVIKRDAETVQLLEAIGERVAPIFRGSMAFEQSLSKALTDPVTKLPNERAFFMVLENQLAESHRYRDERPLTVLSLDIKNFADANAAFGHATGDKILGFVSSLIRKQLRKMDFLARSVNDEFLVILPTANEKTALEIIERIKISFANSPFKVSNDENLKIWLNYGWATFWQDGETAQQLLQNAQLRKQQTKSAEPSKVLWFPKEYVN